MPTTNQEICWNRSKRITAGSDIIQPQPMRTTSIVHPVSTATVKGFATQGRPRKVSEATAEQMKHDQQQGCDDATARMAIEGKFGQGKRRLG